MPFTKQLIESENNRSNDLRTRPAGIRHQTGSGFPPPAGARERSPPVRRKAPDGHVAGSVAGIRPGESGVQPQVRRPRNRLCDEKVTFRVVLVRGARFRPDAH